MKTIADLYGCTTYGKAKNFLAGLECEIEAVPPNKAKSYGIFSCKEDGSLRNNGWEYISVPEDRATLVEQFTALHKWLGLDHTQEPFSVRTSIHVHVNASSLSIDAARNMVLLYALYEKFFFGMVKPERQNNIHCVPLTETHLPMYYNRDIYRIRDRWSKYSALNLLRLADLGTFEFRHHHGTGNANELDTWLHVLENLWKLSQKVEINEETLSDVTYLYTWWADIFSPSEKTMMLKPTLMNIISNSLIDVKFSTIKE